MSVQKRVVAIGGAVVTAASVYAARGDLGATAKDIADAVSANWVASLGIAVGLLIVAWAYRDELRRFLGLPRSDNGWVRQITKWTLEDRQMPIKESRGGRDSFKVVFEVPMTDRGSGVTVTAQHNKGSDQVVLGAGLVVADEHKKQLERLSADELDDIWDDLAIAVSERRTDVRLNRDKGGVFSRLEVLVPLPFNVDVPEMEFLDRVHDVVQSLHIATRVVTKAARRGKRVGR